MPGAGFYAIHVARIRFGHDGQWYADDERIENRRIADLFSRNLRRAPGGGYMIQLAEERAAVEIDDTPFVITSVQLEPDGARIVLNDGSEERLDPTTLEIGVHDVLYCRVKDGERARFLRPAYYQLMTVARETAPGEFVCDLGGGAHRIVRGAGE